MTVREYIDATFAQRVPEREWHAFLASRSWFDPGFLRKATVLMEQSGVVLATYAYLQESSGARGPLPPSGVPWRINPVFAERHAIPPDPSRPAINLGFFTTWLERQK